MTRGVLAAALLLVVGLLPGAAGEVIVLKGGQRVHAEVLREFPERVVVDLGFELLSIPREQIQEILLDSGGDAGVDVEAIQATDDLYSRAQLPEQTVKQLAQRFGEGVVLVSVPAARGSGFFISTAGHVITNFHVIEGETRIAVTAFRKVGAEFRRQRFEDVDIVATNPFLDVALLRVNLPADYTPVIVYLSAEDELRDGDRVFAIGNPLGLERSVSQGIVSKRNRALQGLTYVQTTTQINPGNSGGPLFNMRGEVVGVTNMGILAAEGLNFAIPIRYVIDFLRNRDAFTYNSESSEAGYRYPPPADRQDPAAPPDLK
jgi:serine protease Do